MLCFVLLLSLISASRHVLELKALMQGLGAYYDTEDLPFPPILTADILNQVYATLQTDGTVAALKSDRIQVQLETDFSGMVKSAKLLFDESRRLSLEDAGTFYCLEFQVLAKGNLPFYQELLAECQHGLPKNRVEMLSKHAGLAWGKVLQIVKQLQMGAAMDFAGWRKEKVLYKVLCNSDHFSKLFQVLDDYAYVPEGELLGAGTYGRVYKSFLFPQGMVAVKQVELNCDLAKEFYNEVRISKAIQDSPYFVKLHKAFMSRLDTIYLVMDLLNGKSLLDFIHQNGAVKDLRILAALAKEILLAIQALHAHGFLHNDISHSNVFLTTEGGVKVLDFGFADDISNDFKGSWKPGAAGRAGPEMYDPDLGFTPTSDAWNLATTILFAYHGVELKMPLRDTPFSPELKEGIMQEITRAVAEISDLKFKTFLESIFKYDPKDRASIEELLQSPFIVDYSKQTNLPRWIMKSLGVKIQEMPKEETKKRPRDEDANNPSKRSKLKSDTTSASSNSNQQ